MNNNNLQIFKNLQSWFHKFDRVGITRDQFQIDQAPIKTGHNISWSEIRSEKLLFLNKQNANNLIKLVPVSEAKDITNTELSQLAPSENASSETYASIRIYHKYKLKQIPCTNGYGWYISIRDSTTYQRDFISPTDVTQENTFADGFNVKLYTSNGEQISPDDYIFDYYAGIVIFNPDFKTTQFLNDGNAPVFTGFQYIGKHADDTHNLLNQQITNNQTKLEQTITTVSADLTNTITAVSADLGTYTDGKIQTLSGEFVETSKNLNDQINALSEDFSARIAETEDTINTNITEVSSSLTNTIVETSGILDGKIDTVSSSLTTQIDTLSGYFDVRIEATADDINDDISDVTSSLTELINTTSSTLDGKIGIVSSSLNDQITTLSGEFVETSGILDDKIDTATSSLTKQIDTVSTVFDYLIAETTDTITEYIDTEIGTINTNISGVTSSLTNTIVETSGALDNKINIVTSGLNDQIDNLSTALDQTSDNLTTLSDNSLKIVLNKFYFADMTKGESLAGQQTVLFGIPEDDPYDTTDWSTWYNYQISFDSYCVQLKYLGEEVDAKIKITQVPTGWVSIIELPLPAENELSGEFTAICYTGGEKFITKTVYNSLNNK